MSPLVVDSQRSPKGDHNRRIALGLSLDDFAAEAGIDPEALRRYETTGPDDDFDLAIAHEVGVTLEQLEAIAEQPSTNPPAHFN